MNSLKKRFFLSLMEQALILSEKQTLMLLAQRVDLKH